MAGGNVLVKGRPGVGKSAIIRQTFQQAQERGAVCVLVDDRNTKAMALSLLEQLHKALGLVVPGEMLGPRLKAKAKREGGLTWNDLSRTMLRLPVMDAANVIVATMRKQLVWVFVEGLEVGPQKAELFTRMIEVGLMAAAIDDSNRRTRISKMAWRFQTTVELKPLTIEQSEQITRNWLEQRPIRFTDERTKDRFINHVARDSGGIPAAIRGMLETASMEEEVTPAKARTFDHGAGVTYLDMTPLIVLALVVAIAGRYISRGLGETDMLVLSGVASALFMGLRFFMYQMRAR
ncbi:hypothetical protein TBH_C0951 [Thiolapillus brandeum]|uniref:Uncharacterized protein n=1 Tax=Thiolapillus brandeum TaxID=1076588 RepID=A0A7U6JH04_9GAMM|nr:hypothetical protein TBH_C0951 [Thiolapillus brandeum]